MRYRITWLIRETTTYQAEIDTDDLNLPPAAYYNVVMEALQENGDLLAPFEDSRNEIRYDNSDGRVPIAVVPCG